MISGRNDPEDERYVYTTETKIRVWAHEKQLCVKRAAGFSSRLELWNQQRLVAAYQPCDKCAQFVGVDAKAEAGAFRLWLRANPTIREAQDKLKTAEYQYQKALDEWTVAKIALDDSLRRSWDLRVAYLKALRANPQEWLNMMCDYQNDSWSSDLCAPLPEPHLTRIVDFALDNGMDIRMARYVRYDGALHLKDIEFMKDVHHVDSEQWIIELERLERSITSNEKAHIHTVEPLLMGWSHRVYLKTSLHHEPYAMTDGRPPSGYKDFDPELVFPIIATSKSIKLLRE